MYKNIVIGFLVLIILAETGYMVSRKLMMPPANAMPAAGPNARGGRQIIIKRGMDLKSTPVFKYAFQVYPGDMSTEAKQAMIGFKIETQTQKDKSATITFTPKDSEDQKQVYTVKNGQILYFIEQTPADDVADQDKDLNYRDDYGLITDAKGIVQ